MPTASWAKPSIRLHQTNRVRSPYSVSLALRTRDTKLHAVCLLLSFFTLVLPGYAQQSLTFSNGKSLIATVTPSSTVLHLGHHRILLRRDNSVARPTPAPSLKLLAELPGQALLLTDTYRSRSLGLSQCQAGEEQFLRLITLKPQPKETFHLKLASCRDNLELADKGLQWSPTDRTLTVRWLTPPANQPNPLLLHLTANGHFTP